MNRVRACLMYAGVATLAFGAASMLVTHGVPAARAAAVHDVGLCERYAGVPSGDAAHAGMVRLPAGRFTMGSDRHYREEAVAHDVNVEAFWIDRHDVTNAQYARFVAATGYVTVAERTPDAARQAELPPAMRVAGSAVFVPGDPGRPGRWRYVPGADWRHPEGPGSHIHTRANHPVVHIAYDDATAYARWLGRELPTEAQWEYAARGGLAGEPYVWGRDFAPQGRPMANTWQGVFPLVNTVDDGHAGTSPVGCFPANGHGLYDMAGNVWQWTSTWYRPGHDAHAPVAADAAEIGTDPRQPGVPARVIKGGSHLCAPDYCMRYRPAARQAREVGAGTSHIGFRTVLNR